MHDRLCFPETWLLLGEHPQAWAYCRPPGNFVLSSKSSFYPLKLQPGSSLSCHPRVSGLQGAGEGPSKTGACMIEWVCKAGGE